MSGGVSVILKCVWYVSIEGATIDGGVQLGATKEC